MVMPGAMYPTYGTGCAGSLTNSSAAARTAVAINANRPEGHFWIALDYRRGSTPSVAPLSSSGSRTGKPIFSILTLDASIPFSLTNAFHCAKAPSAAGASAIDLKRGLDRAAQAAITAMQAAIARRGEFDPAEHPVHPRRDFVHEHRIGHGGNTGMKQPTTFLYEQDDQGIATITLNRPERLNALTFEVYRELTDTFAALREESAVRVVIITGAGRAFCSGGDVHDIIGELFSRDMEGLLEFTRMTCELIQNIRALPKPVIASLNGTTAGAGACIALASDIRIASEDAKIAFLVVKVGLAGTDMLASYLLPRVVGLSKATEMLYTGDFVSAAEAERIGLYNRVVPAGDLLATTREFAAKLARGPAFACDS